MPSDIGTDIVISGARGPIAAVEVKNRQDLTRGTAATLRRNMLVHHVIPPVPYFLLVSEDKAYLWVGQEALAPDALPSYEFSMRKVIDRYLPKRPVGRLRAAELELLVFSWLGALGDGVDRAGDAESLLSASGFLDAIQGATIARIVA